MHQITDIHTRKGGSLSWAKLICKLHDDLHGMKRSFRSKRSHHHTPWNRGQQIVHFTAGSFLETIPEEREIEDEAKEFVLDHIVTKNEECDATFDDEHSSGWDTTGITTRPNPSLWLKSLSNIIRFDGPNSSCCRKRRKADRIR
ncbi:BgtAc-30928 [Blumeria graminis f. sp. tritici]|uniref:BgtAc-30928 n=2 Tax=Blumeria graminis f. sp. tritici TaxID=62690 RepID=A0A9X9QCV3_BLUGR|nr:hypothetical protein BGT96224_Ac30928 [Blumeria graminis f. sp. tritici 96224]VDB87983.1 BgtAc-30928 [Blumeria graminis f. sp. tritici]